MTSSVDVRPTRPEVERAEELVDGLGDTAITFATRAGVWVLAALARAREEAEDVWAEAQSISRGQQS
jgi:hypothetical protein